jgi:hypothetical protein
LLAQTPPDSGCTWRNAVKICLFKGWTLRIQSIVVHVVFPAWTTAMNLDLVAFGQDFRNKTKEEVK